MRKQVFIINGQGGVGKDTICACAARYFRVRNVSSITPIVEIAKFAGWDWEKTLKARRLLAQLKEAFTAFNDLSFRYCMDAYEAFLQSDDEILFLHVREPREIERLRRAIGPSCRTLLVRRPDLAARQYGNQADDGVGAYAYDLYFDNEPPLDTLPERVKNFFQNI